MRVMGAASLVVMGLVAACAPPLRDLRVRASAMLHCADAGVQLRRLATLDYAARGCGRQLLVRCVNDDAATCHTVAATPAPPPSSLAANRTPAPRRTVPGGAYTRSALLSAALAP